MLFPHLPTNPPPFFIPHRIIGLIELVQLLGKKLWEWWGFCIFVD